MRSPRRYVIDRSRISGVGDFAVALPKSVAHVLFALFIALVATAAPALAAQAPVPNTVALANGTG